MRLLLRLKQSNATKSAAIVRANAMLPLIQQNRSAVATIQKVSLAINLQTSSATNVKRPQNRLKSRNNLQMEDYGERCVASHFCFISEAV